LLGEEGVPTGPQSLTYTHASFHYAQAHMEMENKGLIKIKTDTPYRYTIFISLRLKKLLNFQLVED
jgi:hypothetical protein